MNNANVSFTMVYTDKRQDNLVLSRGSYYWLDDLVGLYYLPSEQGIQNVGLETQGLVQARAKKYCTMLEITAKVLIFRHSIKKFGLQLIEVIN